MIIAYGILIPSMLTLVVYILSGALGYNNAGKIGN